jgi:hypothetical protein
MRETIEFRVPAGHADGFLEPGLGTMLGDSVRKIVLLMEDPRVKFIADLDREFLKKGRAFVCVRRAPSVPPRMRGDRQGYFVAGGLRIPSAA